MPVAAVSYAAKLPTPAVSVTMLPGKMPFVFADATATVLISVVGMTRTLFAFPATASVLVPGSRISVPTPARLIFGTVSWLLKVAALCKARCPPPPNVNPFAPPLLATV